MNKFHIEIFATDSKCCSVSKACWSIVVWRVLCTADLCSYAMSFRDYDEDKKDVTTKHYLIRKMDSGVCYISPTKTFNTLLELIEHYKGQFLVNVYSCSKCTCDFTYTWACMLCIVYPITKTYAIRWCCVAVNADELCCKLSKTCPRTPEPVPFLQVEVDRSSLRLSKRLAVGQFSEVWQGEWWMVALWQWQKLGYLGSDKSWKLSSMGSDKRWVLGSLGSNRSWS